MRPLADPPAIVVTKSPSAVPITWASDRPLPVNTMRPRSLPLVVSKKRESRKNAARSMASNRKFMRVVGRSVEPSMDSSPSTLPAEAHAERPHDCSSILYSNTRCDRLHGKVGGCDDTSGIECHIHVHGPQPFDMQRHVREQLALGRKLCLSLRLLP